MPDKMLTPCWDPSNVRRAISSAGIALLAADDRPYFLATHAPITRIWDERAHRRIDEVMFFKNVMMATGEVMAAVHGAPGTGKSHLIHWLKLRTDDALTEGTLQDVRTVLIQRSTGTLKDALTQMLQQLGGSFERHLEPVRQALEKISDHSAREKLLLALSLEVGSLRQDRGKPPLPRSLRGLAEACRSEGFGRWLCRPGGAIDLNIRRLTEPAGPDGAAEMAEFTAKDLNPPPEYRDSRHIAEAVRALLDELDDVEELRTKAAAEMNDALRH
ncbi:MAG: AAA family ATPase, partial [Bacillota bacterium]